MQLALAFPKAKPRGGARLGAGRKPRAAGLRHTPHRSRGAHRAAHPVHVTMRAGSRSLRHPFIAKTVLGSFRAANRAGFRIVHYSIQANHLHLIVEAKSAASLSSGMRGLAVRIARRVNPLLFRRGPLWVARWHGCGTDVPEASAQCTRLRVAQSRQAFRRALVRDRPTLFCCELRRLCERRNGTRRTTAFRARHCRANVATLRWLEAPRAHSPKRGAWAIDLASLGGRQRRHAWISPCASLGRKREPLPTTRQSRGIGRKSFK